MNIFRYLTPAIYWLLSAIWSFILIFLIIKLIKKGNKNKLILILIIVLAIEAFRTTVESIFFSVWSTSLSGFISAKYHLFLTRPEILILPKILNLIAASAIVLILIRRWFSAEEHERENLDKLIKEVHHKLDSGEKMLNEIAENYPNSFLYIINKDMTIGFISGQQMKREKIKSEDFLGKAMENIFQDHIKTIKEKFLKTFNGKEESFELNYKEQWRLYKTVPLIDESGNICQILVVEENITDRKTVEKMIQNSLLEKESMLKEIHHRVKNNLAVISSLLSLQEMKFDSNSEIKNAFQESKNRIKSMAAVHEKLYLSENLAEINFKDYIEFMADELHKIYIDRNHVELIFDLDKIFLSIEKAIPCGLILNELLTNAFKYAFKEINNGEIAVSFKKTKNQSYNLTIQDNGNGMPDYINFDQPISLGFELVHRLTEQINGRIEYTSDHGSKFTLIFD